jgi:uncharacterized membrane protein YqiK
MADFVAWFITMPLPIIAILAAVATVIRLGNVIRYIPNDSVGIVEKIWSLHGSIISGFIALHSEAGFQPNVMRGGIHFFKPFMYKVHVQPLVMIGQVKSAMSMLGMDNRWNHRRRSRAMRRPAIFTMFAGS